MLKCFKYKEYKEGEIKFEIKSKIYFLFFFGGFPCLLILKLIHLSLSMWDGAGSLFLAAQNGHSNIVQLLLTHGVVVDQERRDGATPLWISSQMGHQDCVRLLLEAGAGVDTSRADGATPLFKACHKGHEDVVREILKFQPRLDVLQVRNSLKIHHVSFDQ